MVDNIDTDQIIPARFLSVPRDRGYGDYCFHDLRIDGNGAEILSFPMNTSDYRKASIIVGGRNFGCGSSREGAVYALMDRGIRAVLAPSFGDIFQQNALVNGLVTVSLPVAVITEVWARLGINPDKTITLDIEGGRVQISDGFHSSFDMDPFRKYCIVEGIDEIDFTFCLIEKIDCYEKRNSSRSLSKNRDFIPGK
ncbi:3-isopropylmalate dehydratase small subunit [Hyphomicrobiales bacterium]|nr:3-isopropylmalate dehydratase small subunit [Hyphomicrobiales bacterium]